ncbi:uncharacterized protein ARMOST_22681 [Armillaria ostoyae]|uniref:Uncharacterized protein n=1 Tax=Armillaria ostoyae TaxID=47428 RepID=A0A284REC2_ARMOS|nr:uncharacterized protein ARMOST_10456 [Armillaria ostoyae]SJL18149.1 uncharacterized protein ARMOST_21723 [Armillaria ostoyae]SJL19073.1 uncharacterized protein ARMOST_22681 [Armillaria ostoyae]
MSLQGRITYIPELHVSASGYLNFGSLESLPLSPTPLHIFRVNLDFTTWNEDGLVQGRKEHIQFMLGSLFACNIGSCKRLEILGPINGWLPLDPNIMFHDSWDLDSP